MRLKFKGQRGFTLIELLVALLIAGIFFSIFIGVVLATFETLRTGDERTVAQQNARVALNFIANDIRHTREIAPLRLEAYRDWADGGFPLFDDSMDPFDGNDAWPIYRRSVDSDPTEGYIDLSMDGVSTGDGDEYATYRDDGMPYDVRPLAPNRISLLFYGSTYYPATQYYGADVLGLGVGMDIDNDNINNPTSAITLVTYEHQLVEPLHPEIYGTDFSGRSKNFHMLVNSTDANSIGDDIDFVIVRSFEAMNPKSSLPDVGDTARQATGALGSVDDQIAEDEPYFRQAVADHVLNMRFRYWHISGNLMLEIRYDPDESHAGTSPLDTDDGYYRYFNIWGEEIYVWYNFDSNELVPLLPTNATDADWDAVPVNSFYIHGGDDGTDRFQQGILLFEGWKFVNAISVSMKTSNNQTLDIYRSSINNYIGLNGPGYDPTNSDYGMGFIDFGLDFAQANMDATLNAFEPLYQAADNMRISSLNVGGNPIFDFVEPNMNPNYDGSTFVTLQTMVAPPALKEQADMAARQLTYGLSHKYFLGN